MKKLTKWIAMCLTLCCLLTLLPMNATAAGQKKLIALTFDDGPGPYTNRLLDGLAERNVHVTFFELGMRAEVYDDTTRRIYAEGHQIAQHGYDHKNLINLSSADARWQITHTKDILNDVLGRNGTYLVRPPYGDRNSQVLSLLDAPAILWSIDPRDWQDRDADIVRERIVSRAYDGAIILCHDIYSSTVDGSLMAIDDLLAAGYEFVTVNELFRRRGVTLQNGETYFSCKPNGTQLAAVAAPTISIEPMYGTAKVKLSAESGAAIYYTMDGSDPAVSGIRYNAPFAYRAGDTVRACAAYDLNGSRSETVEKKLVSLGIDPKVSVKDGKIVFENKNKDAVVRYTTDGTAPTEQSAAYTAPISCFDGVLRFSAMGTEICTPTKTIYVTKNGNLFWDVPNTSWYFDEVDRAVTLGLFNGTGVYRFDPNAGLTRAMFVTTIYRLMQAKGLNVRANETKRFDDVPEGEWYSEAAGWAAQRGLVLGYEDGTFRPDRKITREEMCVILDRLLTQLGVKTDAAPRTFADADKISPWAKESVDRLSACGIVNGQMGNCFAPKSISTRAEAATVLLRLYDLLQ